MKGYNYPLHHLRRLQHHELELDHRLARRDALRLRNRLQPALHDVSFIPTADWLWSEHSLRAGYELRRQRWNITNAGYGAGRYFFNGAYTRLNNSAPLNDQAQEWAQFLLGLPTVQTGTVASSGSNASQFEIAANGDWRQVSHALFLQDDWHFNSRLTVNVDCAWSCCRRCPRRRTARWADSIRPSAARSKRRRWRTTRRIPSPRFRSARSRSRRLKVRDGGIYNNLSKLMPRHRVLVPHRTEDVIRGGWGLFSYDYYFDAGTRRFLAADADPHHRQQRRDVPPDLTNPIPNGTLVQPSGRSLGAATASVDHRRGHPSHRREPYYNRWQLGAPA